MHRCLIALRSSGWVSFQFVKVTPSKFDQRWYRRLLRPIQVSFVTRRAIVSCSIWFLMLASLLWKDLQYVLAFWKVLGSLTKTYFVGPVSKIEGRMWGDFSLFWTRITAEDVMQCLFEGKTKASYRCSTLRGMPNCNQCLSNILCSSLRHTIGWVWPWWGSGVPRNCNPYCCQTWWWPAPTSTSSSRHRDRSTRSWPSPWTGDAAAAHSHPGCGQRRGQRSGPCRSAQLRANFLISSPNGSVLC